uniref:Uncharacterized protein n=1 Tax=Schistosoma curassoni TaxID=6186 RepID=A0A183K6C7_9TREM
MNQDRNKGQSGRINIQNNDNKRNIKGNNNNRHGSDRQHRLLLCDLFFTVIILLPCKSVSRAIFIDITCCSPLDSKQFLLVINESLVNLSELNISGNKFTS